MIVSEVESKTSKISVRQSSESFRTWRSSILSSWMGFFSVTEATRTLSDYLVY